jgi:hypothetical protein
MLVMFTSVLASCDRIAGTPLPTPYPTEYLPTVIAMTVTAQIPDPQVQDTTAVISDPQTPTIPSPVPTLTDPPSPTPQPPIATPSPFPSPTQPSLDSTPPEDVPPAAIQILSPGPASKVVSPFILRAAVHPGPDSVVRIELLGEDGRLLMREVRSYQNPENEWLSLGDEVTFGFDAVAENGRLQIAAEDQYGRIKSLSSVDLFLLSMGRQDLNQPLDQLEAIVIQSPRSNTLIQGGTMRVAGLARLRSSQPLMIEISTSDGKIVGTRQVSITPSNGSMYGTFEIDVPFTVASTTRVRLQIWEPGEKIPGIVNLSSLEVILSP